LRPLEDEKDARIAALESQLAAANEALSWYEDENNYHPYTTFAGNIRRHIHVEDMRGRRESREVSHADTTGND
jgi:hypothetical protein